MGKFEEFKLYRDKYGLNQLTTNGQSGDVSQNGALFTMEYLIWLINDEDVPEVVKKAEIERLKGVYQSLETFPGVSSRFPGGTEFDSMDNASAIATFSGLFDEGRYSKLSHNHGLKTFAAGVDTTQDPERNKKFYLTASIVTGLFCKDPQTIGKWILSGFAPRMFWNNNDPTKFCFAGWHGRSPAHSAILRMTAGKIMDPVNLLIVLIAQFLGCFSSVENTDARKLPYVVWQFLKKRSPTWNFFYKIWCFILTKQYTDGMRGVYSKYYQDPNHPIRKYSKPFAP